MRTTITVLRSLLVCAAATLAHLLSSQTIVQDVDLSLGCAWDAADTIDVGMDGSDDLRVYWLSGIDNVQAYMDDLTGNYLFAYPVMNGQPYGPFWGAALLSQTTIGCFWNDVWLPNTGLRYIGFKRIDTPTDTTFGWVEMDFHGDGGTCEDTLEILRVAYNTVPNVPLGAGDLIDDINERDTKTALYFDAVSSALVVDNTGQEACTLTVLNALGQCVLTQQFASGGKQRLDMTSLTPGGFLAVTSSGARLKFVR